MPGVFICGKLSCMEKTKLYIKNLIGSEAVNRNHLLAPVLTFGLLFFFGLILFGTIVSFNIRSAINSIANKDQSITVTGTTERNVTSDTAKWTISVAERSYGDSATINASKAASVAIGNVKNYLIKNGISEDKLTIQSANLSQICDVSSQGYENCSLGIKGETASQNIIVETEDVNKIKELSERITNEITNTNISNNSVEYYYNKLKDIRVDMLSQATANAKERADAVAKAGGATVGNITSLSTGVFQVTQKNSVSVDDYGAYDTSSIEKKITATVKVNFSVR